ncbi:glutathione S-transferase N-terminal domain-containing protein [Achromobacter xylosoxidans]
MAWPARQEEGGWQGGAQTGCRREWARLKAPFRFKLPSMIVKALRVGLGQLIVLGDALTRPRPQQRSAQGQAAVDSEAAALSLYQFHACPFCVKTRRAIHRLNVPVALRDAKGDPQARAELQAGGGKVKVPCLRIEEAGGTRWMYESSDIIAYLEQRYANVA